ncbi:MinD/ParA family protein [Micrococcaceae bacterium RIT802]|nr:MinD/ParA family protein [Micrococcaceae bacterium RIT 802]
MTQPHQNHDDEAAGTRPEAGRDDAPEPVDPDTESPAGQHDHGPGRGTAGQGAADVPELSDWEPAGDEDAFQETSLRPVGDGQVISAPQADQPGPLPTGALQGVQDPLAASPAPESAAQLTADRLLEPRDREPAGGWRRLLFRATFGRVNVGDSDTVRIRRQTERRIAAPLEGATRYVPVLSRKGGVGKTTVTTLLGMSLAQLREDRIIALDANPDRGTLSDRSPGKSAFTARHLVQNRFMVDTFSKLSSYAAREGSRLHVLASDTDPRVAEAFDDADYRAVTDLLSKYYSIVLTDSGTGMVHTVMKGTLEKADAVVLVSGASVDEARLASETLSWLEAHGRSDLASNAIVVINQSSGQGRGVNVEEIEAHFRSRVATVVRLPHDPHLAEGSRIELDRLKPATRDAARELAALVVDELKG